MKALVLDPTSPFSEVPRSDTLFGAICWGIRRARGEEQLEEYLAAFADGQPPFTISSAVPVLDPSDPTYLLPKPRLPGVAGDGELPDARLRALRTWNRLDYLPASVFANLATGNWSRSDVLDDLERGEADGAIDAPRAVEVDGTRYVRVDEFLLPAAYDTSASSETGEDEESGESGGTSVTPPPRPYESGDRLRNAVNRVTSSTDGQLFTEQRIHVREDAGFGVLARGDVAAVAEGLAVLQDRGIGGNKSVGNGQFRMRGVLDVDLPDPEAEHACTLSLCVPREAELGAVASSGYYEVETRKGVVADAAGPKDGIWKRRVLALAEGSLLPTDEVEGHNPVVADRFEHGVQQYGHAFDVGMMAVE